MDKYILELTGEELNYLDNFIHENSKPEDYYDVGTFRVSAFSKICDLCEDFLGGGGVE
jgi:hypothetical protein